MGLMIPNTGGFTGNYAFTNAGIPISNIKIEGLRKRPLNQEKLESLKQSILDAGQLLAPVGVRAGSGNNGGPYTLIYGAHRLHAIDELFHEGKWPNHSPPCVVFTSETPDWFLELAEIDENLARSELTASERSAHMVLKAGIMKKHGLVATPSEKKAANGKKGMASRYGNNSVKSFDTVSQKPTVSMAMAKQQNISRQQVHNRARKAFEIAGEKPVSIDKADADTLIKVGRAAMAAAPEADKQRWQRNQDAASKAVAIRKPAKAAPSTPDYDEDDEPTNELSESIDEVLSTLRSVEKLHGIGVVQEAIKRWWKEKHPQGRVPFQTTSK